MVQVVEVGKIESTYSNPVAELVQTACKYESHITVQEGGKYINAKIAAIIRIIDKLPPLPEVACAAKNSITLPPKLYITLVLYIRM